LKNQIDILIRDAEEKWLDIMEFQVKDAFSNVFLPSHDASHHKRVWKNGKKILTRLNEIGPHIDKSLVEGLLISVYFHDQGMVLTRKAAHGKISRQLCEKFFEDRKLEEPENFIQILDAIESHDIKMNDYYAMVPLNEKPELLTLLSIADDLDALGTIGIYRYAEIYLHRGVDIRKIGINVMENVSTRFNNFSKACNLCPELINNFKSSYTEIISFFDKYNQQIVADSYPEKEFNGHIGIINYIRNFSVSGKIHPEDFTKSLPDFEVTKFVLDFFIKLEYELTQSD